MTTNVPTLTPTSVLLLTDEQLIAWYSKHPNPTVKALIARIDYMLDKHKGERIAAYQAGFAAAQDHFEHPNNPHGLTPEELRIGTIYAEKL